MDDFAKQLIVKIVIVIVVGVLAYFLVLRPILVKIGIIKSSEEIKQEDQTKTFASSTSSPFSPSYYKNAPGGAKLVTRATAEAIAKQIDSAIGNLYDDENAVYSALRQLQYKTQLSFVADVMAQVYHEDLYTLLVRNLSDKEMAVVNGIAANLL